MAAFNLNLQPMVGVNWAGLRDQEFIDTAKECRDKFLRYRRGQSWEAHLRRGIISHYKVPRSGRYRGPRIEKNMETDPDAAFGERYGGGVGVKGSSAYRGSVQDVAKNVANFVRRYGLQFNKILGWGTYGVACLFDQRNMQDVVQSRYVIKYTTQPFMDLKSERIKMRRLNRAQHVVRHLDNTQTINTLRLPELLSYPKRLRRAFLDIFLSLQRRRQADPTPAQNDEIFDNLLFLEYCPRGNLDQVIHKSAKGRYPRQRRPFTERVLWHLFDCPIKGCIGMQLPRQGPPVMERVPSMWPLTSSDPNVINEHQLHLVHFDIDPCNTVIGREGLAHNNADDPHDVVPPFHLNDFGTARYWRQQEGDDLQDLWNCRYTAKKGFFTPEQFTEGWDFVTTCRTTTHGPSWPAGMDQSPTPTSGTVTTCSGTTTSTCAILWLAASPTTLQTGPTSPPWPM
ncbi:hypothetical protein B0H63DRAFT_533776 [Podospora didyma]|uniref:Protein kinase domain-containing protein n=1 Tax=Podospora didyma TaxID=330526 RepID=A0AAE0U8X8_9PEZI|nr:hypothetical protein B0H63DRAFT_533776 [Podospora didyma]